MKKILSCGQMRQVEAHTIREMGMPSMVLMERAALSLAEELERCRGRKGKILIVCGTGNNGGDGIALGRILHLRGFAVSIYIPGNPSKFSEETGAQLKIADNYGVHLVNNPRWNEYTTIVDAIFGIGLDRDIEGIYQEVIKYINEAPGQVWSVDIPSGIHSDTGRVMGQAVRADKTVAFGFEKRGHCFYPGASYCGTLLTRDIGIREDSALEDTEYLLAPEDSDLQQLLKRCPYGNKGTFGKVLVVAGSHGMAGAAYLCGKAALTVGAGMVKIHTVEENRVILQQQLPEALLFTDDETGILLHRKNKWMENLHWCDAIVIGPGMGTDERSRELISFYLSNSSEKPVIIDADGLNMLSSNLKLLKYCGKSTVLTPHMGEMCRLTGCSMGTLKSNPRGEALKLAKEQGVVCVLKDARTLTVFPNGQAYLNLSGNQGMATAGSGDVLAGILGGFFAGQPGVEMNAPLGVYLHGLGGDRARERYGSCAMTAANIAEGAGEVLRNFEEQKSEWENKSI